ncbi:metal-dependent hydrolase [Psychromonas sp. SR45-3]|uniref:metal-dependent hydrolase n=1 Tax=Psychromonas sp. SR45-3 TaxID=2760930 RepID=UPI0015FA286D|nr:metal-dependent hydrolase [Psychromonas sp. SR45-3]MBB1274729.1 metal-dependent hydrolase [Psychromonas sp. SR45-3]
MANFNTHFNVAAVATGLAAATLLSAEHINLNTALGLWFLGTIGGLLPDIDSDNSTSLDIIFNLFAFSAVLIVLRYVSSDMISFVEFQQLSLLELIALPLVVYALMRYLVRPIFEKITVHRGSCHSLSFVLLIALFTTQIIWRLAPQTSEQTVIVAWLSGGFVFLGGVIHLTLDELYSVDLSNVTIKRSFGSALKLADFKNKSLTLVKVLSIAALAYTTPSPDQTINTLSDWSKLKLSPYSEMANSK